MKYIFSILFIFIGLNYTYAGGDMGVSPFPSDIVYNEDGTQSGRILCEDNSCQLTINSVVKARYQYIESLMLSWNDFYAVSTDSLSVRHVLRNGVSVAEGELVNLLYSYGINGTMKFSWYTVYNGGTYSVYRADGSLMLEEKNVWNASN